MGFGFIVISVLAMALVSIPALLIGIWLAYRAWRLTVEPIPRRVLKTVMRFCTPFIAMLTFGGSLLAVGIFNALVFGVPFDFGDSWVARLSPELKLIMIDATDVASIEKKGSEGSKSVAEGLKGFQSFGRLVVARSDENPEYYLIDCDKSTVRPYADITALQEALAPNFTLSATWLSPLDFYLSLHNQIVANLLCLICIAMTALVTWGWLRFSRPTARAVRET